MAGFWRLAEPILDKNGVVIKGGLWDHQRRWWDSNSFIKALVTGYGGGKTFIGAKRSISMALHNAPKYNHGDICPHLVVSPSYKIAKRTIIPALKTLLRGKQTLAPGFSFKHHVADHAFTVWYQGREGIIWIASGDDPDSLKGPNIGSALIDEPFIQDEDVLDQILARVRSPIAKKLEIGLTGTPESLNWGYDICEGDRKDDYDIEVVHANTRANRALHESYADRLEKGYSDLAAQAYVDGQFVSLTKGTVYYGFSDENIIYYDDPGGELFVGMDFNVNPMAAVVFWVHGNHMHVMNEIELPNADTEYMCSYLKDIYVDKDSNGCRITKVYPDATGSNRSTKSPGGKSDFYYIKNAGFSIDAPPGNPLIRDRENAVNGKFKPRDGADVTLTISPHCKKLISYLRKYTHENKNKQKEMSHLLDSFGYPVHRLFPIVKPDMKLIRIHGA